MPAQAWLDMQRYFIDETEDPEAEAAEDEDDQAQTIQEIPADCFLELGLDVDSSRKFLTKMIAKQDVEEWERDVLVEALADWRETRVNRLEESKVPRTVSLREVAGIPAEPVTPAASLADQFGEDL